MLNRTLLAKLIEYPEDQPWKELVEGFIGWYHSSLSGSFLSRLCYDHLNYMFWFNLPLCLENQNLFSKS